MVANDDPKSKDKSKANDDVDRGKQAAELR